MKFKLTFDVENSAFITDDSHPGARDGAEIARILRGVAKWCDGSLVFPSDGVNVHDINGNKIGEWRMGR